MIRFRIFRVRRDRTLYEDMLYEEEREDQKEFPLSTIRLFLNIETSGRIAHCKKINRKSFFR